MDFQSFKLTREALLGKKHFEAVRTLEEAFLKLEPNSVQALHMSAWTSKAMGDSMRWARKIELLRNAHQETSKLVREKYFLLAEFLAEVIPGVDKKRVKEKIRELLNDALLDESWGWLQAYPVTAGAGQISEIPQFGRFKIENPESVIEKRLARGLAWEASLVALVVTLVTGMNRGHRGAVLDIGANIGTTAIPFAMNLCNQVYAFEPEPNNFSRLKENSDLNSLGNLNLRNEAIGSKRELRQIEPGPPDNPGKAFIRSTIRKNTADLAINTTCRVETLDDLFSGTEVSVVKIDVEGFEFEVIDGAKKIVNRDHPLIFIELLGPRSLEQAVDTLMAFEYTPVPLGNHNYLFY